MSNIDLLYVPISIFIIPQKNFNAPAYRCNKDLPFRRPILWINDWIYIKRRFTPYRWWIWWIHYDYSRSTTRLERTTGFRHALETKGKKCKTHVVADDVTSDTLRDLLYNELRFGVRTLIFVANCFLLPRVYLTLKDYRNLMPDTIGLIGFDNTE